MFWTFYLEQGTAAVAFEWWKEWALEHVKGCIQLQPSDWNGNIQRSMKDSENFVGHLNYQINCNSSVERGLKLLMINDKSWLLKETSYFPRQLVHRLKCGF